MKKAEGIVTVLCLAALLLPVTEAAKKIAVTNTYDSGPGSLRQAIADSLSGDEIVFDPIVDGQVQRIVLDAPLLLTKDLTIVGRGAGNTIIDGNLQGTVLSISGADSRVVISGATITGGNTSGDGGGIHVAGGSLTLIDCVVSGNSAGGRGGGIYSRNVRSLVLRTSTISENTAGVYGGGIFLHGSEATFENSTIAGNSAGSSGGGTYSLGGTLTLDSCTVSGNGGGLRGGGIYNGYHATVSFDGCTVTGNTALYGGGGIDSTPSSFSASLRRTIVAHNGGAGDCFGVYRIFSLGYNLDSDGTCELSQPTDVGLSDPLLGPLADNGGPTWTHALMRGSPAVDAGSCPGTTTDQRGFPRPTDAFLVANADDGCDVGAFEYQPPDAPNVLIIGDILNLILVLTGEDHDLVAPLQDAIRILDDGDPGNDIEAVVHLEGFIAEVEGQRGLTLGDAEADALIAEAQRLVALLSSGGVPVGGS